MASVRIRTFALAKTSEWNLYVATHNADVRLTDDGRIQAKVVDPSDSGIVSGDFWDEQQEVWSEGWYDIGFLYRGP